jgi:hypothetical protein
MLLLVPGESHGKARRVERRTGSVRVGASSPGLAAATTDAVVSRLVVLVQAAVSSASAAAAQVAGCGERRGRERGRAVR